ncbi:MAG: translation elongation factor Ts, partial [Pseudomonadota bacterium]
MVKELRERTGAGMMECKKALVEADADMDAAVELLRKSGQAKADKKAGRVAADGRIVVASAGATAVIVEVNSETDFVSKDDNFGHFAEAVAASILTQNPADLDAVGGLRLEDGRTVGEARAELIAKVGENIGIRRFARVASDDNVASYVHGSRIGAVVAYEGGDAEFGRDVAMHVSATNPLCISEADVPGETLAAER